MIKLLEELLSQGEVKKLVKVAERMRDKALIFALYESGCRIGKLISLKLKHVEFDKHGAKLMVGGKTGDEESEDSGSLTSPRSLD